MPEQMHNARGRRSRDEILSATYRLVSQYGYDKTGIAQIVRETGKPASSIYWLFGSKDELIAEAVEKSFGNPSKSSIWQVDCEDIDFQVQLVENLYQDFLITDGEDSVRVALMLALEGAAENLSIKEPFMGRRRIARQHFSNWWKQAIERECLEPSADIDEISQRMAVLTMWFIDGHYVADGPSDADRAHQHAEVVSRMMIAASKTNFARGHLPEWKNQFWHSEDHACELEAKGENKPTVDEALRNATSYLIAKYGVEGATLSRICKLAGVKKSSLYWRYKDKDALISAAVADKFSEIVSPFRNLKPLTSQSAAQAFAAAANEYLESITGAPYTSKAALLLAVHRWNPPTSSGEAIREVLAELEDWLTEFLANHGAPDFLRDENPQDWAWALSRLLIGMAVGFGLGDNGLPVTERGFLEAISAISSTELG